MRNARNSNGGILCRVWRNAGTPSFEKPGSRCGGVWWWVGAISEKRFPVHCGKRRFQRGMFVVVVLGDFVRFLMRFGRFWAHVIVEQATFGPTREC